MNSDPTDGTENTDKKGELLRMLHTHGIFLAFRREDSISMQHAIIC